MMQVGYEIREISRQVAGSVDRKGRHLAGPFSSPLIAMILFGSAFSVMLVASPASAQGGYFSPPHSDTGQDTDGDGRFNFLHVDVNVFIDMGEPDPYYADAFYYVEGRLHDASFVLGLDASSATGPEPGTHGLRLSYDGRSINASGADGPYRVDLTLGVCHRSYEDYFTWECGSLDVDVHTTAAYSHLDFDEPAAYFTPPHADAGQDTDGDGRFNFLQVDVNVTVDLAATYRIGGQLRGASPSLSLPASRDVFLGIGAQTVRLSFDGLQINMSAVDGPYAVDLEITDLATSKLLDTDMHTTAASTPSKWT